MTITTEINGETLEDLISIHTGLYHPLTGFMTSLDYENVVDTMRLGDQSVWTIPVTLDVPHGIFKKALDAKKLWLTYNNKKVAFMEIHDCYKIQAGKDVLKIFKTDELKHPGVKKELGRSEYRIGGKTQITDKAVVRGALDPARTKRLFKRRGWKTVVGFQTRNPLHTAHEFLQRLGLDICDGLFINPSVGWKRAGDFTEEAVMRAYECMIGRFYPKDRVHLEGLKVYFRYAGPREAIFHALIRKNLGCTHFIIGRDHAGVGDYYGTYEAHDLARDIMRRHSLGIELLLTKEPYYCKVCGSIVTEKHCRHTGNNIERISGSYIRSLMKRGMMPEKRFMRPEVAKAVLSLGDRIFIK
ncbi:MAG: sulfate adenylyltransferase [Candidatus Omnitrophica bacterium]|nr:sulfate adenylyltransferase [Candidatus Omnitrophota bacterium]